MTVTTIYEQLNDVFELNAHQVDEWLKRGHGWARRHIVELGGYREGTQYRFPIHAIRAYQLRMAQEFAEQRRSA